MNNHHQSPHRHRWQAAISWACIATATILMMIIVIHGRQ